MTVPTRPTVTSPARTPTEVARRQVEGIERFNLARHQSELAEAATARSREMRMDSARRLEVLRREHDALVARAQQQLETSGGLLHTVRGFTVLLAHRNAWFLDRVGSGLSGSGLTVVGCVDNGADAIGQSVAEQPDLLLVEDTLAMVPGEDVVREVRRFCPDTRVVAHVAHADRVEAMLGAGATEVYTRRVPPADVAAALRRLVSA